MPTNGMPVPGLKAVGRKMSNSLCMESVSKDHSGRAGVGDGAEDGVLLVPFHNRMLFWGSSKLCLCLGNCWYCRVSMFMQKVEILKKGNGFT